VTPWAHALRRDVVWSGDTVHRLRPRLGFRSCPAPRPVAPRVRSDACPASAPGLFRRPGAGARARQRGM